MTFPFNRQLTPEDVERAKGQGLVAGLLVGMAAILILIAVGTCLTSCDPMYPSQPKPRTWWPGTNHCYEVK